MTRLRSQRRLPTDSGRATSCSTAAVAQAEGACAGQRLLPDYKARLQSRAGQVLRLVWPGAAAGFHQGHRERMARGTGSRQPWCAVGQRITAVRNLAVEVADNGLLAPELATGITRVKGVASKGVRLGNWLWVRQAQTLLNAPNATTPKRLRDRAILGVLLGCGLRRPCPSVMPSSTAKTSISGRTAHPSFTT